MLNFKNLIELVEFFKTEQDEFNLLVKKGAEGGKIVSASDKKMTESKNRKG